MRTLSYSLQTAFKSVWNEKWVNFLTMLSVAIGLLIISAFFTVTLNVDSLIKRWSKSFGLVVYLDGNISKETEETLKDFFEHDPDVRAVDFISKKQAIEELADILGDNASVIEDIKGNPLPSSFILKLKRDKLSSSSVRLKADKIKEMRGVEAVQYGEKWLSSLNTLSDIMKISASFLGVSIFIAIVFITYNTIKIFFYRRRDEVETLKLLGATKGFIRLPFLIEGLLIGTVGGLISSLALYAIQSLVATKGIEFFPAIKMIITTLPYQIYILVPVTGIAMSFIGSFIAVGKIKY